MQSSIVKKALVRYSTSRGCGGSSSSSSSQILLSPWRPYYYYGCDSANNQSRNRLVHIAVSSSSSSSSSSYDSNDAFVDHLTMDYTSLHSTAPARQSSFLYRISNNNAIRMQQQQQYRGFASTTTSGTSTSSSSYAYVDHGDAYLAALAGLHGKQLELAKVEALGKDDPPFDPFIEEELEEARLSALAKEESETAAPEKGEKEKDISKAAATKVEEDEGVDDDESDDEDDDDDEDIVDDALIDDWRTRYNNDGSLKRTKTERATLAAGAPSGGLFAIIELAGSQHKVTTDDVLIVNRLQPLEHYHVGSIHTLTGSEYVMLVGSSHYTLVGMPYVNDAEVDVMVEEITKDAKIVVFKKRRRKNSKRKNGFRRDVTMLRILDIRPPPEHTNTYYYARPEPAPRVVSNNKQQQQQLIV